MRRPAILLVAGVLISGLVVPGVASGDGLRSGASVVPVARSSPSFVIASFNMLGHSHTERGGKFARMSSGDARLTRTSRLFRRHNIAVAGLQEVHPPQYEVLKRKLRGYSVYPGPAVQQRNKQNVVVWKSSGSR